MSIWQFFQDEILGMKGLNRLIGNGLSVLGLDTGGRMGGSVQFFLYDVIKITVLLCCLIFVISYIQSYFPPERSKKILSRFHGIGANIISALLGTVTPFCSCSSIPLFIGFTSAGLPLGVTFSFLISSPMVDLGSLVLLMSIFGAKVAVIYVLVGLVIAVAGGTIIEKLHMEPYVESFILSAGSVDIVDAPLHSQGHHFLHGGLVHHSIIPAYNGKAHAAQPQVGELQALKIFINHKISSCLCYFAASLMRRRAFRLRGQPI